MDNLFTIPLGDNTIHMLITPLCRRSYTYRLGQEYFKNPKRIIQYMLKNAGLLLYLGYIEHCKQNNIEPEITESEMSELFLKHMRDAETIFAAAEIFNGYSKLEQADPTVINNIF